MLFRSLMLALSLAILSSVLGKGPAEAGALSEKQKETLRREYILANTEFTVLHEFGHAAFDAFDVPLFSREEEAADTVATVLMVMKYGVEANPKNIDRLLMVSAEWYQEWESLDKKRPMQPYWDDHPLSIERFYNINCLAIGANEKMLGLSLDTKLLPVERGWFCDQEFARAKRAVEWLGRQHARNHEKGIRQRPPRLTVSYQKPYTPEKQEVYQILRDSGLLERITSRLDELIDWPYPIKLSVEDCGGGTDAFYKSQVHTIFLCTDLLVQFKQMADIRAAEGVDDLCANPAINSVMGDQLACAPASTKKEKE